MHESILHKCSIKKILTRVVAAAAVVTLVAGQSVMYAPTIYAVEQKTQANEITQEKTFNYEQTIDGYKVSLSADDGIFPDGTTVSINKVSSDRNQCIKQIIESKIDSEQSITKLVTFDFEFKDPSGNIIEPENGTVSVSVSIAGDVKEAVDNAVTPSVQVYHIDESDKAEQVISNTSNDQVSFQAASFSEYTIVITDGVISGKCGENIEWKLTPEDKILTITGTGEMEAAPWGNYNKSVKKIVISEGITTIADNAFDGCENAEGTLELPTTLKKIGDYAFQDCSKLSGNLVLPENVEKIGSHAFYCCTGLTGKLIIPTNVTSIGIYAFGYCKGFEGDLLIPEGVTTISGRTFEGCTGLTGTVTIPSSLTSMYAEILYDCKNVRKVINNSNLPVILPDIGDDSWVSKNNGAFLLTSITNGTAIRKSDSEGIGTSDISGTVGENITWKLAVDGTLTITGTGEMEAAPWGNYN
ncbi:MAG: leucine-rich repeat domain-containing protein, partial [Lachnospira sp.]